MRYFDIIHYHGYLANLAIASLLDTKHWPTLPVTTAEARLSTRLYGMHFPSRYFSKNYFILHHFVNRETMSDFDTFSHFLISFLCILYVL